jgi:hypothetical protein
MQWVIVGAAKSVFSAFTKKRSLADALESLAHEIDWEAGDPKFLVLDTAKELRQIEQEASDT